MILPVTEKLVGVIGSTFDISVTLYPSSASRFKWQKPATWNEDKQYEVNDAVVGSNSKAYNCIDANSGIQPVGDVSGHWELITPLNIEGYSAEMIMGELLTLSSESGKGITLGGSEGTVKIKAKPSQTEKFPQGKMHFSLWLKDTEENKYEYLAGDIKWQAP